MSIFISTPSQHYPKGRQILLAELVPIVGQVAEALQYAHDQKLVHRDIKPENILLGNRHRVLLSDFGIALILQSSHMHSQERVAGTLAYMAPEHIKGHACPASDQYSLAVMIYEWLCGERLFGGSGNEIIAWQLERMPPSLRAKVPALALAVEEVVLTALAKDPEARFASIQEFASAFAKASQETVLVATPPASCSAISLAIPAQEQAPVPDEAPLGLAAPPVLPPTAPIGTLSLAKMPLPTELTPPPVVPPPQRRDSGTFPGVG